MRRFKSACRLQGFNDFSPLDSLETNNPVAKRVAKKIPQAVICCMGNFGEHQAVVCV
ncbi:hypothetical protein [Nodularia sp. UHCC 0506]|uniref:hypothetical protein n=1 Tax=Nodularia sp. UHCC 0506 TaxID=3110243 RepID=UPI002B210726|nr:hypothetical protein [Nodularia sp. UHCC 0506]MEA5516022.1 hypothetical protein [Nodularia sp. UHCC 0506]